MPVKQTFVTQTLRLYHYGERADCAPIELPTSNQVSYLCQVGLGPIAYRVYGEKLRECDPELFLVLQSADVTARAIYGQLENAAVQVTRELNRAGVTPTLLKGISTADEYYSPPYLRLMGDVDILIKPSEVELVLAKVTGLGYEITDDQWHLHQMHGHHHLPQARHPITGMCIELHTGLFASDEFYSGEYVFQPEIIAAQSIEFDYRGLRVARFTPEFQLIYTLSKWSVDRGWAKNIKNINDTIHILSKHQSQLDWLTLSTWFAASPHLVPITAALVHYLKLSGLVTISTQLRDLIAGADLKMGAGKLKMLTWVLHKYPFNAQEKNKGGYESWFVHAIWLYLSRTQGRNLGIPRTLMRQFLTNALYGKYNPLRRVRSRIEALIRQYGKD